MRFSDITKGIRAVRAITLPIGGVEHPLAVRPLNGGEQGDALAAAVAYAESKGVKAPKEGDRLYDLGLMVATVVMGCVCADDHAATFFASPEEVLAGLDADRIALLYEQHQDWQDTCGARATKQTGGEWYAKVLEVANAVADEDPLSRLRPAMRRDWERTIAVQFLISQQARLSLTSDSSTSTKSAEPEGDAPPSDAAPAS